MVDIGPHVASALTPGDISAQGRTLLERIVSADGLIVSSPTYKGTYPGMFKHLFDLIDPEALIGRPVLLAATGGGARHALMVEHQLRPLFGFFSALTVPTSIYVSDADFADDAITERQIVGRIDLATRQFAEMLSMRRASPLAMTG